MDVSTCGQRARQAVWPLADRPTAALRRARAKLTAPPPILNPGTTLSNPYAHVPCCALFIPDRMTLFASVYAPSPKAEAPSTSGQPQQGSFRALLRSSTLSQEGGGYDFDIVNPASLQPIVRALQSVEVEAQLVAVRAVAALSLEHVNCHYLCSAGAWRAAAACCAPTLPPHTAPWHRPPCHAVHAQ